MKGYLNPRESSHMEMHDLGHLAAQAPHPQQASPRDAILIESYGMETP